MQFAHDGVMVNAGQCCIAGSRTFVHEKIYDQFVAKSRELAEKRTLVTGDPFDPNTQHGPQVRGVLNTEMINSKTSSRSSDKANRTYVRGNPNHEIVSMDKRKYSLI